VHLLRAHLRDHLEDVVPRLRGPVLVMLGEQDGMCTEAWARHLAGLVADGRLVTVPGPHTFLWRDPASWREPVHELAAALRAEREGAS
jgi:pimeloyl-ACP methyl ester carboxylesterase